MGVGRKGRIEERDREDGGWGKRMEIAHPLVWA